MDSETAHNASDLYIQRMDLLRDVEEVVALRIGMMHFFEEHMANVKRRRVSAHVPWCWLRTIFAPTSTSGSA